MSRTITRLMEGWSFALGERDVMPNEASFAPVCLPHDWAVSRPVSQDASLGAPQGYFTREEIGWYKCPIALDHALDGRRLFLDFGGIYENSTVWVNGTLVGSQHYGYTPFRLDVTRAAHMGENEIVVRVDNTLRPADRWYSGCGIYRTVRLIETDSQFIDERNIVVRTEVTADEALVHVDIGKDAQFCAKFTAPNGQCAAQGSGTGHMTLPVKKPELWSAETPNLYALTLSLSQGDIMIDEITLKIGLRDVRFTPGEGLFVNGQHTVLKGVCVHQDVSCAGVAATKGLWRARLLALKALGCNSIRPAHHVYSEEFMDLCDELGFYVYEECFDKWHSGLYGRYFDTDWQADLSAMILRDRNRPSVLIWGVGNEVENQGLNSVMLSTLHMLTDYARSLDPTRPVSYAMNPHYKRSTREIDFSQVMDIQKLVDEVDDREVFDMETRLNCICAIAAFVDIISCNYQEQWYADIHERLPDKLILGTEVMQYFRGHRDHFANYCEEVPSLVPLKTPYVIGGMIWAGYDYLGESRYWPSKGWTGSLMRSNGLPRASVAIHQSLWLDAPMVRFFVLDYTLPDENTKELWSIPPYEHHWDLPHIRRGVVPYMVVTNCERVEIALGNDVYLLPAPKDCPNGVIKGFLPYTPGTLEARGYVGGRLVCRDVLVTPGKAKALRFLPHEGDLSAEAGEMFMLTVKAVDEQGTDVMRESRSVTFSVEGPASLFGTDNGDMMELTPYPSPTLPLWRGQASVMLRLDGHTGSVKVRARAEGLIEAIAEVHIV